MNLGGSFFPSRRTSITKRVFIYLSWKYETHAISSLGRYFVRISGKKKKGKKRKEKAGQPCVHAGTYIIASSRDIFDCK
jgi:hypothetical protein